MVDKQDLKDYYEWNGCELFEKNLVSNAKIYNLSNMVRGSKFPMNTDAEKLTNEVTKRTVSLGSAKAGSGHDCALKGVLVVFDLTWTVKASVELQRYHFIDFVSSQSTMHRIARFDLENQYIKYVDKRVIEIMKEKVAHYNAQVELKAPKSELDELYLELLYTNPNGFQLTAEMTTNYLQLKTIYNQRKNHKLPEWKAFCKWCETLPLFKELCFGESQEDH